MIKDQELADYFEDINITPLSEQAVTNILNTYILNKHTSYDQDRSKSAVGKLAQLVCNTSLRRFDIDMAKNLIDQAMVQCSTTADMVIGIHTIESLIKGSVGGYRSV